MSVQRYETIPTFAGQAFGVPWCGACGALVWNQGQHNEWHEELADQAGENKS